MQRIRDYKGYNLLKFFDIYESFQQLTPKKLLDLAKITREDVKEGPVKVQLGQTQTTEISIAPNRLGYQLRCPICNKAISGALFFPHNKDPRREKVWACSECHGALHGSYAYGGDSPFEVEVFSPLRKLRKVKEKLKDILENGKSVSHITLADLIDQKNVLELKLNNNKRYQLYREVLESGGLTDVTRPRS